MTFREFKSKKILYITVCVFVVLFVDNATWWIPRTIRIWSLILLAAVATVWRILRFMSDNPKPLTFFEEPFDIPRLLQWGSMAWLLNCVREMRFVDGNLIPIILYALVIGSPLGALATRIRLRKRNDDKSPVRSYVTGCLVVAMAACILLVSLNYALENDPPQQCTSVILDKKHYNEFSNKSPDIYKFELSVDEHEFYIRVSPKTYNNYNKGDEFLIQKYNGALGQPFYVSEP